MCIIMETTTVMEVWTMFKRYKRNKSASDKSDEKRAQSFEEILLLIEERFKDCPDIIRRKVSLKDYRRGLFIYVEELIDKDLVQRDFINTILNMEYENMIREETLQNLPVAILTFPNDADVMVSNILAGNAVFIGEDIEYILSCDLKKLDKRSIEEPETEKNVRGSHEGFIEVLKTNMGILRRRIKNSNLKFKTFKLGTTTNQMVVIAYIEDIANPSLLEILSEKIGSINFDGFLSIGAIEQFITDHPNSPFPQYQATERPDKVAASLLEGKLVVMLDSTPVSLIVPVNFFGFFQAPDDYSTNWMFGTFLRILRLANGLTAIFLPAIYIAILSFHYYAVPLNLLIPLAESRARVPFPPIVEALIMELTLETLREASIRLPTYIGTSIGVVGGLIIGQAAVEAGIVSNLMVIVVAVTAIASFVIPNYDMGLAIRLIRFFVMIAASIFGIIGIIVASSLITGHLVTLESLGQPYFQPLIPFKFKDLKDTFIRLPIQSHYKRPDIAQPLDNKRGK